MFYAQSVLLELAKSQCRFSVTVLTITAGLDCFVIIVSRTKSKLLCSCIQLLIDLLLSIT
jgi:hypothetical protein